ncbi:MAG: ABC transporter ATP-binding protein [Chloroflexota bacterium]
MADNGMTPNDSQTNNDVMTISDDAVNTSYIVEMEDVWRVYKTGSQEVQALRGVDMRLKPGEFVALMGRSGSGKTTLLNCLGGLDRPTSGVSSIFGQDLSKLNDRQLTRWRRERVGFIFQSFGLLPTLSAFENVELMLRIKGTRGGRKRRERAEYCLDLVGLKKWMDHRPYELSGGQQQRVAIARALANEPQLILADEPTGELDTNTAHEILTFFKNLVKEEKITMLMVTHDNLSVDYVDYVLRLRDGQIMQEGSEALAEGE